MKYLLTILVLLFVCNLFAQKIKNEWCGYTFPPVYIITYEDKNGKDSVVYERDAEKYYRLKTFLSIHRKHELGMIFSTYPPVYSCHFCFKEISPMNFLPKVYSDMRIPMPIGKDTLYWNGYGRFCDSLRKNHINEDSFFMAKWNEKDTSCISSEIRFKQRKN